MKTGSRRHYLWHLIMVAFIVLIAAVEVSSLIIQVSEQDNNGNINTQMPTPSDPQGISDSKPLGADAQVAAFAKEHGLSPDAWPEKLIKLLEGNPETKDFVLNYPLKKDQRFLIDLREHVDQGTVPLFLQWDERWGYTKYGNEMMGLSGCGPTCLSMVCVYLRNDPKYTPRYIADFAQENGYCVPGSGSAWTLISVGGEALGLDVTEIPLDESRIIQNLQAGNPIICVMGPGDFTTTGHFIVMTGYVDGKIKVNDPNSPARSEQLWDLDDIWGQILNLWVCR